tara:strand:+ start:265 stop:1638 length:1374 start_codon:yes stop_codon:yes gene_type:complete
VIQAKKILGKIVTDTIVARATSSGQGGIGIVRLSGPKSLQIAKKICEITPKNRFAHFCSFKNIDSQIIDQGICLFFKSPNSFTGDDVVELHGHGGIIVIDQLIEICTNLGARLANAGEFSERAFLNGKLDLTQAEAISDLINSDTKEAARLAARSLTGHFSKLIYELVEKITTLRAQIEADIDFPTDDIDSLSDLDINDRLAEIITFIEDLKLSVSTGKIIREGIKLVISGPPNVGKSCLRNVLAGTDDAIVADIPGTTRDVLREKIEIKGIPVDLIDTAGIRDTNDEIEQLGRKKALVEIEDADLILWVFDGSIDKKNKNFSSSFISTDAPIIFVQNKADKNNDKIELKKEGDVITVVLSAKKRQGINLLIGCVYDHLGLKKTNQGDFLARRRHLEAINRAHSSLINAKNILNESKLNELVAEDLRLCQNYLSEITGDFVSDDLLGKIFSDFCIGK